jgi:hypothetical protein
MASVRFRSRFLHATFVDEVKSKLVGLGWITPPVNFGTMPVQVIDYQPDERTEPIRTNTVAVSLADYTADEDEELGTRGGGLRSAPYSVYVDVFMAEQALSQAICDDIRDAFTDYSPPLVDQITGLVVPDTEIDIVQIVGPERPGASTGAESFRRYWRTMRLDATLYFSS